MFTSSALRWCVRLCSIVYYFAIVPFLYDLFMNGASWRSVILFPFILLAVAGLQIGFKENDSWVNAWFWSNLFFVASLTCFAFFYPPFAVAISLSEPERWLVFGYMAFAILCVPANHFFGHVPIKRVGEDDDIEKGLPPVPNQNPAK